MRTRSWGGERGLARFESRQELTLGVSERERGRGVHTSVQPVRSGRAHMPHLIFVELLRCLNIYTQQVIDGCELLTLITPFRDVNAT